MSNAFAVESKILSRRFQASALRFVVFNQLYDFGLEGILRRVERSDGLSERLLLELFLDRQAKFSQLFDIRPRVKLQLL